MRGSVRSAVVLCAWLLAAGVGAGEVRGQTRADSAAVLLDAAEQLRLRGETGAARALLQLIAQRYAGTPAAAEVDRLMAAVRRTPEAERSGRTELLVFSAGYGAWLGVALPLALESDSPEAYGVGLLLGAPAGFFAAKRYADARMPSYGQARALTFGGVWGTYMGMAIAELFDIGSDTQTICPAPPATGPCQEFETDTEASTFVAAAVTGGLLGIGTGAFLARKPITAGTAAAVTLGGMWGTWFGFGLSFLADQREDELLAGTMIGGNAALLALGLIAPRWQMSESRARLISVGGLVGGLAGAGLLLIVQPDDDNTAILFPLVGSAAGLTLATHWTRDRDPAAGDGGRGALINRSGGRWVLDMPDAALRLQRHEDGTPGPAVYVPILRARF
ncbi:MAG TPA: hypothetical protein VFZ24_06640 [Longimicrobiales bacterium]